MRDIQNLALLCIVGTAVLLDLQKGRIPNGIIVTGILWGGAWQLFGNGVMGILLFLGGVFLPILLFGAVYYFRMMGAGDIKLMCVIGSFLGPSDCFSCITAAILFGGMISLVLVLRRHNFSQRLICLSDYIDQYSRERKWSPYLAQVKESARFCFSVPLLLGTLCYIGGII